MLFIMANKTLSPPPPSLPDDTWRREFRRKLLAWYRQHARDLPWRENRDPYRVWLSEIMLQQTQVATVIPYFRRFLAALPTIADLAAAREEEVLRLWEGLGYYRRARQLHAAAKQIVAEHGGEFPRDFEAIRALPGIGRYTAGAIASIAFDSPQPILEANTIRLFARLLGDRADVSRPAEQAKLWDFAAALLPSRGSPGEINQALMELGSGICTPREPSCLLCPARELCPTAAANAWREIPAPKAPKQYEDRLEAAVVIRRRGKVLLRRCGADERWAGLWDFPRFAVAGDSESSASDELPAAIERLTGLVASYERELARIKHGVTRFRITLLCLEATIGDAKASLSGESLRWVALAELDQMPLSTTGRKIAKMLE